MNTKERITQLLLSTQRDGMEAMIEHLNGHGFFESPASTKFHGVYAGGLADHSLRVFEIIGPHVDSAKMITHPDTTAGKKPLPLSCDSVVIATLLHDVCKAGAYVRTKADNGWTNNKAKDKGHAKLSIERISKYIKLTPIEELMIRYHMGIYGANEFEQYSGEFPLGDANDIAPDVFPDAEYTLCGDHSGEPRKMTRQEKEAGKVARYGKSLRNAWYHNPVVKVMYFCDELATLEEKAKGD